MQSSCRADMFQKVPLLLRNYLSLVQQISVYRSCIARNRQLKFGLSYSGINLNLTPNNIILICRIHETRCEPSMDVGSIYRDSHICSQYMLKATFLPRSSLPPWKWLSVCVHPVPKENKEHVYTYKREEEKGWCSKKGHRDGWDKQFCVSSANQSYHYMHSWRNLLLLAREKAQSLCNIYREHLLCQK